MQTSRRRASTCPGFAATQDFGPFFGFVKGAPAAAELIVQSTT